MCILVIPSITTVSVDSKGYVSPKDFHCILSSRQSGELRALHIQVHIAKDKLRCLNTSCILKKNKKPQEPVFGGAAASAPKHLLRHLIV